MKLPTLYKLSSKGKLMMWEIEYGSTPDGHGTITTRHGQVDGKIQGLTEVVTKGKNVGRANETTPVQQAQAEAESEHQRQIERKGYTPDREKALKGENEQAGGVQPMLAHPIEKINPKHLEWPAHVQPKLDGLRCIAVYDNGEVTLWSRKCERIEGVPHVAEAVKQALSGCRGPIILDGELYTPGMGFQQIASFVRTKKEPKPGHEQVQYHVYDTVSQMAWSLREGFMAATVKWNETVKQVPTVLVCSMDDVKKLHDEWVQQGFEGAMLRQLLTPYEIGKRSNGLAKVKQFDETEFTIVSVHEGRGKFEGTAIFRCVTAEGKEFDCCAPGTMDDRRAYLQNADKQIGQQLTTKHFGWTDDGLPRFPIGKDVRQGD